MPPGNHNVRRITRILVGLQLLGLPEYARAFFECLEALYRTHCGRIDESARQHWRQAVRR